VHAAQAGYDGTQPGDPAKPLGNDAADMVAAQLENAQAEFRMWEEMTRSTDIGAGR
jgi:hypothetical protein